MAAIGHVYSVMVLGAYGSLSVWSRHAGKIMVSEDQVEVFG